MRRSGKNQGRLVSLLIGVGLLASACSGGNIPDDPAAQAANEAAAANIGNLAQTGNVLDAEVLDVRDGSISSLRGVVDGDRPVLVWFWAPH